MQVEPLNEIEEIRTISLQIILKALTLWDYCAYYGSNGNDNEQDDCKFYRRKKIENRISGLFLTFHRVKGPWAGLIVLVPGLFFILLHGFF